MKWCTPPLPSSIIRRQNVSVRKSRLENLVEHIKKTSAIKLPKLGLLFCTDADDLYAMLKHHDLVTISRPPKIHQEKPILSWYYTHHQFTVCTNLVYKMSPPIFRLSKISTVKMKSPLHQCRIYHEFDYYYVRKMKYKKRAINSLVFILFKRFVSDEV